MSTTPRRDLSDIGSRRRRPRWLPLAGIVAGTLPVAALLAYSRLVDTLYSFLPRSFPIPVAAAITHWAFLSAVGGLFWYRHQWILAESHRHDRENPPDPVQQRPEKQDDGTTQGASPSSVKRGRRWLRETPLFLGILIGLGLVLTGGDAFRLNVPPTGFDWREYLQGAWMVVHRIDVGFGQYRSPLYPGLLGWAGEYLGYVPAAVLLSSIGISLMVIGTGIAARLLANPWAGGLAALSAGMVQPITSTTNWVSAYPVMSGLVAATLAAGTLCARKTTYVRVATAGISAGLAWAMDERNLAIFVGVGLLVWLGSHGVSTSRRLLFVGIFGLCGAVGLVVEAHLALCKQAPASERYPRERAGILEEIQNAGQPELSAACAREPRHEMPNLAGVLRPCARALGRHNVHSLDSIFPFGTTWTLLALPLTLLPRGRGRRGTLEGLLVFGPPALVLVAMALWMIVPLRYVVPFAAPMAMVVPVAVAGVVELLCPARLSRVVMATVALGLVVPLGTRQKDGTPRKLDPETQVLGDMLAAIRRQVPPDEMLVDCSSAGIQEALLPARHGAPPSTLGVDPIYCRRYVAGEEGRGARRWVVTRATYVPWGHIRPLPSPVPADTLPKNRVAALLDQSGGACEHGYVDWQCPICSFAALSNGRWVLVHLSQPQEPRRDGLALWRRRDPGSEQTK